jgi:3-oxoacyl-[acyl-carrier protein] reductase
VPDLGYDGKVAIITGAGGGLGRQHALLLASRGALVVVNDLGGAVDGSGSSAGPAQQVVDEIKAAGGEAVADTNSVATPDGGQAIVQTALDTFGRVDIVVNNAGAARGADRVPVVDLDPAEWLKVIDVNLNGTFLMSRAFGRRIVEHGDGGSIVNISSVAGKIMGPTTAAYSASKAGIHALTCAMAGELGPDRVRVNAICPGIIDTYRMDDVPRGPAWDKLIERNIPLRRAGSGEDIAWMVLYLCSDQGSWITGQLYTVDGGMVPGR